MSKPSQEQSQIGNDVVNKIHHTLERWDQRLTLDNPNFIDRYEKGELQILLKFTSGIVPKEYVILFQGAGQFGRQDQNPRIRFRRFWENVGIQA